MTGITAVAFVIAAAAFMAADTTAALPSRSFQQEFLKTHNDYRAKHGAPPMTLNHAMSVSAQKWAEHLLAIRKMAHSKRYQRPGQGENIYYAYSSRGIHLTGKEPVQSWYSEIKDYNWNNPGFSMKTGHFTQVVWKASTELGVGMATDGKTVFVVGRYKKAGNMRGDFRANVLKGGSSYHGNNANNHANKAKPRSFKSKVKSWFARLFG